jgi:hypothetical protein
MDEKFEQQLDEQSVKIAAILTSVKKTERYFKVTMWITIIVFVLPLLLSIFVIPSLINSYTETLNGLM